MPELPEVETLRRGLEKHVVGHSIKSVEILHPGVIQGDINTIIGKKIISVRRIGKGLILDLSNNYSLGIHVKLTGQVIYRDRNTQNIPVSKTKVGTIPNSFTHVVFELDKKGKLYYNDQRRFGWIKILPTTSILELPFFKNMGPEPFKDLTHKLFEGIVQGKTTKIKPLLMNQEVIGGIGNIYANDALFKAGIDPRRPANSLNKKEVQNLYDSIIAVMEKSFQEGGASELSFVNILGQEGNYQRHVLVYGKDGQKCPRKDGIIKRVALGGRGTFFCENCQT